LNLFKRNLMATMLLAVLGTPAVVLADEAPIMSGCCWRTGCPHGCDGASDQRLVALHKRVDMMPMMLGITLGH
jgi:hypothetical protein